MKIRPKRYIVWSTDEIDLGSPFQRKWFIQQVLLHGRAEDVAELSAEEIEALLPELSLPEEIRRLWEDFFKERAKHA